MKLKQLALFASFIATLWTAGLLHAVEITLPEESTRLKESPLPGYALATTYCYTCHSMDYVPTQPVSSRTYWKAAVTKMQKTFGAPIPDDAIEPIVDYIVKTYGTERNVDPAAKSSPAKTVDRPLSGK